MSDICIHCVGAAGHDDFNECKNCGKTTKDDPLTLFYCPACAAQLGICRSCGRKLDDGELDSGARVITVFFLGVLSTLLVFSTLIHVV